MALLDFLKNKEEADKKAKNTVKKPAKSSVAKPKKVEPKVEAKKSEPDFVKAQVGKGKFSYDAIKKPHISEKASDLSQVDQYIFEVSPNYNKHEIAKSVEGIYGVNVLSVNIVKIPAKKRRLGKTEGFRKAYKKAIVKIKEGQKIEIL